MPLLGLSLFAFNGSRSTDFPDHPLSNDNPLPPCPDSPNCIRLTMSVPYPPDSVFGEVLDTLKDMGPEKVTISRAEYKIDAVFKVFFFRDDINLRLSEKDSSTTLLHLRSASRVGYSDLGVNRRRVKKFRNRLKSQLRY